MKCPLEGACLGAAFIGNNSCNPGYAGQLCSKCDVGYYQSSNQCVACTIGGMSTQVIVTVIVLAVILVGLLLYAIAKAVKLRDYAFLNSVISGSFVNMSKVEADKDDDSKAKVKSRAKTVTRLKIIMTTFQVISHCPSNLNIQYPAAFSVVLSLVSVLKLDFFSILPVSCFVKVTYIDLMLATTLLPIFVISIMALATWVSCLQVCRRERNNAMRRREMKTRFYKFIAYLLMLTYIIMPPVSL